MILRSDEEANEAEVERDQRLRSNLGKGVAAASAIAGTAAGTGLVSRVMPFLNKYIPVDLAIKGIGKVSPRMGELLKKGQSMGMDVQEGMDFIKEKLQGQQQPAKQNRNIIEQESPELHQFIDQEIRGGRKPIEAGAIAQSDKKFSSIIKKLMKAHKAPWSNLIESVYGTGEKAQPNPQEQSQTMEQGGLDPQLAKLIQQGNAILQKFKGA